MKCMLNSTGGYRKVRHILRLVFIHQCIDDPTDKCIPAAHSVQNIKCKRSALICPPAIPHICFQTVFTAARGISYMSGNAFYIRIPFHEFLKYTVLFFQIWLVWNIIFHISIFMMFLILPSMIWLDSHQYIYIWKTLRTEISCFFPAP